MLFTSRRDAVVEKESNSWAESLLCWNMWNGLLSFKQTYLSVVQTGYRFTYNIKSFTNAELLFYFAAGPTLFQQLFIIPFSVYLVTCKYSYSKNKKPHTYPVLFRRGWKKLTAKYSTANCIVSCESNNGCLSYCHSTRCKRFLPWQSKGTKKFFFGVNSFCFHRLVNIIQHKLKAIKFYVKRFI